MVVAADELAGLDERTAKIQALGFEQGRDPGRTATGGEHAAG